MVTSDCKKTLPVSYNYQIQLRMPFFFNTFSDKMKKDILSVEKPHIIHYAAELKPWMTNYYFYPYNREWHHFKKISPWKGKKDQLPEVRPLFGFIKRFFYGH